MTNTAIAARKTCSSFLLLLAICIPALFWQLGTRGLNEPDEGRYASIAHEMVASGNWLIPQLQQQPHFSKPPLAYWLMALSIKLFGGTEWAMRLIPALAGLGILILTWLLARRWYNSVVALGVALVLLTTPMFYMMARITDPNMLLSLWIVLAIWSLVEWQCEGKSIHRWIFYFANGLAFLTKGPVGPLIVLFCIAGLKFIRTTDVTWRPIWHRAGFAFAAIVGLSWYLVVAVHHPDLWSYFIKHELIERMFSNTHGRSKPFWYFFEVIPAAFLTWLPLLIFAARHAVRNRAKTQQEVLLFSWIVFSLLLFSSSSSKLPAYVLPLYPALALLCGYPIQNISSKSTSNLFAITSWVIATALPLVVVFGGRAQYGWTPEIHTLTWIWLGAILTYLLFAFRLPVMRWVPAAAILLILSYSVILQVEHAHESEIGGQSSAKHLATVIRQEIIREPGSLILDHAPMSLEFYLHDTRPPLYQKTNDQQIAALQGIVYYVERPKDWPRLSTNSPTPLIELARDNRYMLLKTTHP